MAKAKLSQFKLTQGDIDTQPPFPGGWVLAVFDALSVYAPEFAVRHKLPVSKRTQERIKADGRVNQDRYEEIEVGLVNLVTSFFPNVSVVNNFAQKYVDEYFRLWKQAAEYTPKWVECHGLSPTESTVIGRALVRDLILRLCYLESCERRLSGLQFDETEMAYLRHDYPAQAYQVLISAKTKLVGNLIPCPSPLKIPK